MVFFSCAKDTLREPLSANVYYDELPVKSAEVLVWKGYEKGFVKETETDSLGFFELSKVSRYSLGLESHNLSQKFLIVKKDLSSDTLATPSKNNNKVNDTIYLKIRK